jgi:short-subunit dehydrogenase
MAHAADLGVTGAGAAAVAATLQRFGRVDIVVNNAGISLHQRVVATSFEDVARLMQVNFLAAVETTMEALPGMLERGQGYVMNVTSVAGFVPNPKEAAYGASKAALHRWSHGLAIDLAGTGVHVGELSPGPIDTEIWDGEEDDYTGKKYSPQMVADAIGAMIAGDEVHRTVPRHFGAVGAMYPLPGVGRAMRRGLIAFGRRQA